MRIALLNVGSASLEAAKAALAGEGYEITIANALTFEEVLALTPEVLITEAAASDLSCCAVITQLKSRPETASLLKVLMIVEGGALERARALDLGTDDVISFPFDAVEFAAKIRTQFRERQPRQELDTVLNYPVPFAYLAGTARFDLKPLLRRAISARSCSVSLRLPRTEMAVNTAAKTAMALRAKSTGICQKRRLPTVPRRNVSAAICA